MLLRLINCFIIIYYYCCAIHVDACHHGPHVSGNSEDLRLISQNEAMKLFILFKYESYVHQKLLIKWLILFWNLVFTDVQCIFQIDHKENHCLVRPVRQPSKSAMTFPHVTALKHSEQQELFVRGFPLAFNTRPSAYKGFSYLSPARHTFRHDRVCKLCPPMLCLELTTLSAENVFYLAFYCSTYTSDLNPLSPVPLKLWNYGILCIIIVVVVIITIITIIDVRL